MMTEATYNAAVKGQHVEKMRMSTRVPSPEALSSELGTAALTRPSASEVAAQQLPQGSDIPIPVLALLAPGLGWYYLPGGRQAMI